MPSSPLARRLFASTDPHNTSAAPLPRSLTPSQSLPAANRLNGVSSAPRHFRIFPRANQRSAENTRITTNNVDAIQLSKLKPTGKQFDAGELCGISLEPLSSLKAPVVVHGRLYELDSLKDWLRTNPADPLNPSQVIRLGDIQRLPYSAGAQSIKLDKQGFRLSLMALINGPQCLFRTMKNAFARYRLLSAQYRKYERLSASVAGNRALSRLLKKIPKALCTPETFDLIIKPASQTSYTGTNREADFDQICSLLKALVDLPEAKQNAHFIDFISTQISRYHTIANENGIGAGKLDNGNMAKIIGELSQLPSNILMHPDFNTKLPELIKNLVNIDSSRYSYRISQIEKYSAILRLTNHLTLHPSALRQLNDHIYDILQPLRLHPSLFEDSLTQTIEALRRIPCNEQQQFIAVAQPLCKFLNTPLNDELVHVCRKTLEGDTHLADHYGRIMTLARSQRYDDAWMLWSAGIDDASELPFNSAHEVATLLLKIPPSQRSETVVQNVEQRFSGGHHWNPAGAVIRALCMELNLNPADFGINYSLQSRHPFSE